MPVKATSASFRKSFEAMLNQIPDGPGSCIVIGYKNDESQIIDLIKNKVRLRKEVRSGMKLWEDKNISRYLWIQEQTKAREFDKISIQIID